VCLWLPVAGCHPAVDGRQHTSGNSFVAQVADLSQLIGDLAGIKEHPVSRWLESQRRL